MWDWFEKNKEWAFSGVGLIAVPFLIWICKSLFNWMKGSRPYVTLNLGIGMRRMGGSLQTLTISLINPTTQPVVIGNFVLELSNGETLFLPDDSVTGEWQGRKVVQPGDACSFHISLSVLRETRYALDDFRCALVQTPIGDSYRSTRKELRRFLQHILKEPASA
jgi:hypothetical protein